jgi:serine protease Do
MRCIITQNKRLPNAVRCFVVTIYFFYSIYMFRQTFSRSASNYAFCCAISAFILLFSVSSEAQSLLNKSAPPAISSQASSAHSFSNASVEISADVSPSVVSIEAPENKMKDKRLQYWLEFNGESSSADKYHFSMLGSGVILTQEGYIVTNNHVIKDADEDSILVKLTDGASYFAQLIGQDPTTDLAVLRIYGTSFPTAYVGSSDDVKVGEFVYAIGNPLGLETTVTRGIISALDRDRRVKDEDEEDIHYFIQTDAAINPGNSGGGLFDVEGKLIGINSAAYTESGGSMGLGLAIPSNLMRAVVEDLITDGKIHRGTLGIGTTDVDEDIAIQLRLPSNKGIRVDDIDKKSAAEAAGLKKDDVITEIDGVPVSASGKLQLILAAKKPGQVIKITAWRDGGKNEFSATLQKSDERAQFKKPEYRASLGISVLPVGAADVTRLNLPGTDGVLVGKSYKYSAASKSGIFEDDLITAVGSTPIHSMDDLTKVIDAAKPGDKITLKVFRKKEELTKEAILQSVRKT